MRSIHTVEYYSALKMKEIILTYAITQMNPEDIVLSEISQTQHDKYCVIPLIRGPWGSQNDRDRNVEWWLQGLEGRKWVVSV